METEKNNDSNSQNISKKYPGYAPDPNSGTIKDDSIDCSPTDTDDAARLAATGPVRNPNYHEMDDESQLGNYDKGGSNKQKTLEDFNKTEPKRDINTADVEDKSRPSGIK